MESNLDSETLHCCLCGNSELEAHLLTDEEIVICEICYDNLDELDKINYDFIG